jgi:hypothetical protein
MSHIPYQPQPIPGGVPLVGPDVRVPGGNVHPTDVITPNGDVLNPHVTYVPGGGGEKVHVWDPRDPNVRPPV